MDLKKCYITSSVKLKNQLKIYFKQAFDLFLDLPQVFTTRTFNSNYSIYIYMCESAYGIKNVVEIKSLTLF